MMSLLFGAVLLPLFLRARPARSPAIIIAPMTAQQFVRRKQKLRKRLDKELTEQRDEGKELRRRRYGPGESLGVPMDSAPGCSTHSALAPGVGRFFKQSNLSIYFCLDIISCKLLSFFCKLKFLASSFHQFFLLLHKIPRV